MMRIDLFRTFTAHDVRVVHVEVTTIFGREGAAYDPRQDYGFDNDNASYAGAEPMTPVSLRLAHHPKVGWRDFVEAFKAAIARSGWRKP